MRGHTYLYALADFATVCGSLRTIPSFLNSASRRDRRINTDFAALYWARDTASGAQNLSAPAARPHL
jgi:hypothetical protein